VRRDTGRENSPGRYPEAGARRRRWIPDEARPTRKLDGKHGTGRRRGSDTLEHPWLLQGGGSRSIWAAGAFRPGGRVNLSLSF